MSQPTEYTIGRIEQLIEDHAAQLSPSEIARRVGALLRSGTSSNGADEAVKPSRGLGKGHYLHVHKIACKVCGKKIENRLMMNHVRWNHSPTGKKRGRPSKPPGTGHSPVRMLECKICGAQVKNRAMGNHMATQHGGRKEIL
jgi:hypothetical protein